MPCSHRSHFASPDSSCQSPLWIIEVDFTSSLIVQFEIISSEVFNCKNSDTIFWKLVPFHPLPIFVPAMKVLFLQPIQRFTPSTWSPKVTDVNPEEQFSIKRVFLCHFSYHLRFFVPDPISLLRFMQICLMVYLQLWFPSWLRIPKYWCSNVNKHWRKKNDKQLLCSFCGVSFIILYTAWNFLLGASHSYHYWKQWEY